MSRGLGEYLRESGFGWDGDEILAIKNQVADWLREVAAMEEDYGFCCHTMSKKINEEG